jgi:hypothetical protein
MKRARQCDYKNRQKKQVERVEQLLLENSYTATGTNTIPLAMHFCRDHHIECKSKVARLDFVLTLKNGLVVFLEVDEDQHRFGSQSIISDVKRMSHIQKSVVSSILFLRYNPGVYHVGDELQTMRLQCREKRLLEHLNELGNRIHLSECGTIEIQYAYYDRYYGDLEKPEMCWSLDYPKAFNSIASCVCV